MPLTPKMQNAIDLLGEQEQHGYMPDDGVVTIDASFSNGGQAFINWRTAEALKKLGLVQLTDFGNPDDGWGIELTAEGREWLKP